MRTSHSHGHSCKARPIVALAVAVGISSCSGGDRVPARDTVVATALPSATDSGGASAAGADAAATARPPLPPARDADHEFLRHMLDHHETVIAVAHAQMMEPAGHAAHGGAGPDPTAFDSQLDAEKLEMLTLLSRLYGETFSPRADPAVGTPAAGKDHDGAPNSTKAAGPEGPNAELTSQLRAGVALIDRFLPRLARPEVRDIARRVRAGQLELARQLPSPATP